VVKKLKQLIFNHNPVGQEETGQSPVSSCYSFGCQAIDEYPPLRYGESSYKGDGEKSERGTKKEPIPQTKKHIKTAQQAA
jgi:hypothetical protein